MYWTIGRLTHYSSSIEVHPEATAGRGRADPAVTPGSARGWTGLISYVACSLLSSVVYMPVRSARSASFAMLVCFRVDRERAGVCFSPILRKGFREDMTDAIDDGRGKFLILFLVLVDLSA